MNAEMMRSDSHHTDYVLGDSAHELQRLIRQSALYADLTESFLRNAGISEGMRVLDVGCGPGCVSLLAGRLVGATGVVTGLDKSPQALALARNRANAEHLYHVEFVQGDLADLECINTYDALIGRFVLMFLQNPSHILKQLSQHIRRGGIVAFQEMDISAARPEPATPLLKQCGAWIQETFLHAKVDIQMGARLHKTFIEAGLTPPQMQLQAKLGGALDCQVLEYLTDIATSLLPIMERNGTATTETVQIETLATRLKQEMLLSGGILILPSLIGAWSKLPV